MGRRSSSGSTSTANLDEISWLVPVIQIRGSYGTVAINYREIPEFVGHALEDDWVVGRSTAIDDEFFVVGAGIDADVIAWVEGCERHRADGGIGLIWTDAVGISDSAASAHYDGFDCGSSRQEERSRRDDGGAMETDLHVLILIFDLC
mmetsp:Transcript_16882/g.35708  ORF Transcript_16882/g.35708 Transcript_16882/m.35708 type:complete len:148 (-) Transcript_16882:42-485(-)